MLPELFLERMKGLLEEEYEDFLATFGQERYHGLRLNALKRNGDGRNAAELYELCGEAGTAPRLLGQVPWADNGYYYDKAAQPGKHPLHDAGVYYIQEPSAMAPVTLLEVQPGERILDLCAAPGGKSTQIAAALEGRGLLVCNEIHPARAKILSENIERMGVRNAIVTNETPARLAQHFPGYFDRILVDAPCSGEGMFRKNEIACEEWSPENVELCADRQEEILDCAARMLRPGGRLVYSTCTFAPQENEGSVSRFLERNPEFRILPADEVKRRLVGDEGEALSPASCSGIAAWTDNPAAGIEDTLRLWPHLIKGEGHFAAVLQKAGEETAAYRVQAPGGVEKSIPEKSLAKDWAEYFSFAQENLRVPLTGNYLRFGDHLYLMPEEMPSMKGLKVLRPGLHVGTLKKNRFEPSHALALALAPGETAHMCNLSSQEQVVCAYLQGLTFPAEGEKGWYLICVDGFSIGWGKLAAGMMKNHYPKGLRKNGVLI